MDFNCNNENKSYSSDDKYEDLEKIREVLHNAKRQINKDKLKSSSIDMSIHIDIEGES
ncbi:hypothetical protein SAMN02910384_02491 [Pseudobutyrivibrio sp. ACV-2]|uniref:hypothetical protein n=1 Tax=Pseudobutyrivibrio sp. ACV-2 TaxID=1520801 RepID=UPI00089A0D15|nr:hypothetical protein [Pseudobutyrivibrio sp. ACV-2]SEA83803.1 hypothetical protein SAMN02910384_02491 [Pseudobutyrivibrio sp. ACV-2]